MEAGRRPLLENLRWEGGVWVDEADVLMHLQVAAALQLPHSFRHIPGHIHIELVLQPARLAQQLVNLCTGMGGLGWLGLRGGNMCEGRQPRLAGYGLGLGKRRRGACSDSICPYPPFPNKYSTTT